MSLLDFFFGKPKFHRFDDSYALDRTTLWNALFKAIESQQELNKLVLLVGHFPDTFEALQHWLSGSNIDYEIVSQKIDADLLLDSRPLAGKSVLLALSDLIDEDSDASAKQPVASDIQLSMIVCEPHPVPAVDEKLERFAKAIPFPTQFGYFIALDDPVVRTVINDTVIQIMKQLGLGEKDLIASSMLTKRINQSLRRLATKNPSNLPADSAIEWLAINRPAAD